MDQTVDILAIERLRADYFFCCDEKDWDGFARLFIPDAHLDFSRGSKEPNPALIFDNPFAHADHTRKLLKGIPTMHFGTNPRIDFTGKDTAKATWAMHYILFVPDGCSFPAGKWTGVGFYHDTYIRTGEGWRFSSVTQFAVNLEHNPA